MESFGAIFTILWITLLVVGIVKSVRKSIQKQQDSNLPPLGRPQSPNPYMTPEQMRNQQAQQRWEQMRQNQMRKAEAERKAAPKASANAPANKKQDVARKVAAEGNIENLPHEDLAAKQAKPAESAGKEELKLDFSPEEMVIYSEIMKPGYEKY